MATRERLVDFETAKLEAIKRISQMNEGDEGILYLDNGDGYSAVRIGLSGSTHANIIAHEGMRILKEAELD